MPTIKDTKTLAKESALAGPISANAFGPLGAGATFMHYSLGLTSADPARISLYSFREMAQDHAVNLCLTLKALLIADHIGNYNGPDERITDFVEAMFSEMEGDLNSWIFSAVYDALWAGYTVTEAVWAPMKTPGHAGRWGVRKLKALAPESFWPDGFECDRYGNLLGITQFRGRDELETTIPPQRAILWTYYDDHGSPWGRKALEPAYAPWFVKKHLVWQFMPRHFERFGSPLLIGRVPKDLENETVTVDGRSYSVVEYLTQRLAECGNQAAIAIYDDPSNPTAIQTIEASGQGANAYETIWGKLDAAIAVALLTPPLTFLDAQHQTKSSTGEHKSIAIMDPEAAAAGFVRQVLMERIVRPAIDLNFGPQADYGTFEVSPFDDEDEQALAATVATLTSVGWLAPTNEEAKAWAAERLGIPTDALGDDDAGALDRLTRRARATGLPDLPPGNVDEEPLPEEEP